jgi:hypothetical protein
MLFLFPLTARAGDADLHAINKPGKTPEAGDSAQTLMATNHSLL